MKYTIKFRAEVEMDALSAYHWYERKLNGLGEEFLRIFYAEAQEFNWFIQENQVVCGIANFPIFTAFNELNNRELNEYILFYLNYSGEITVDNISVIKNGGHSV